METTGILVFHRCYKFFDISDTLLANELQKLYVQTCMTESIVHRSTEVLETLQLKERRVL